METTIQSDFVASFVVSFVEIDKVCDKAPDKAFLKPEHRNLNTEHS